MNIINETLFILKEILIPASFDTYVKSSPGKKSKYLIAQNFIVIFYQPGRRGFIIEIQNITYPKTISCINTEQTVHSVNIETIGDKEKLHFLGV